MTAFCLQFQQRLQTSSLLGGPISAGARTEFLLHASRELCGQWHAAAVPAGHHAPGSRGLLNDGRHFSNPFEAEHFACEDKAVSWTKATDKGLFDKSQSLSGSIGDRHGIVGGDRADVHAMAAGNEFGCDFVPFILGGNSGKFWIDRQGVTPMPDKLHRPLPFIIGEVAVGPAPSDLCFEFFFSKPVGHGCGHEMLHQNIKRFFERRP